MRTHCLVALLALLLTLVAAASAAAPPRGPLVGGWKPIKNISDPEVKEIAEFAVSEYNKQAKKNLVFQSVVRGESQVVAGLNYRLVIRVKDESLYKSNSTVDYEAVVFDQGWTHVRKLVSFEKSKN